MAAIVKVADDLLRVDFAPGTTWGQAMAVMDKLAEDTRGVWSWYLDGDLHGFYGRPWGQGRGVTA